jgi:hypothetical protein
VIGTVDSSTGFVSSEIIFLAGTKEFSRFVSSQIINTCPSKNQDFLRNNKPVKNLLKPCELWMAKVPHV